MYENNYDVFEEVDATAGRIAQDGYKMYTNLVRDLIHGYTSDVEKARVLFRSVGGKMTLTLKGNRINLLALMMQ